MKHTKSEQLFKEAEKYIPGGVNSPVRAFKSVGLAPIFADKAHGDRLIDVDGNEYIDYIGYDANQIIKVMKKNRKNLNLVLTNTVSSYILIFVDATEMHRQQAVRV